MQFSLLLKFENLLLFYTFLGKQVRKKLHYFQTQQSFSTLTQTDIILISPVFHPMLEKLFKIKIY